MEGRILSRTPSYDSWSSVGSDMSKAGLSRAMVDDAKWVQAQEERDLKLPREGSAHAPRRGAEPATAWRAVRSTTLMQPHLYLR